MCRSRIGKVEVVNLLFRHIFPIAAGVGAAGLYRQRHRPGRQVNTHVTLILGFAVIHPDFLKVDAFAAVTKDIQGNITCAVVLLYSRINRTAFWKTRHLHNRIPVSVSFFIIHWQVKQLDSKPIRIDLGGTRDGKLTGRIRSG